MSLSLCFSPADLADFAQIKGRFLNSKLVCFSTLILLFAALPVVEDLPEARRKCVLNYLLLYER